MKEFTFLVSEWLADNGEWYACSRIITSLSCNAYKRTLRGKPCEFDPHNRVRTVKFLAPDAHKAAVQCDRYCEAEYKDYLEFTK